MTGFMDKVRNVLGQTSEDVEEKMEEFKIKADELEDRKSTRLNSSHL